MVDINLFKKNLWVLPLIGGILLLLSIFAPASYWIVEPTFIHFWMWGLSVFGIGFTVTGIGIALQIEVLISGLLFTAFILICSILTIILAAKIKNGSRKIDELNKFWISCGLVVILSSIAWIIMIESVALDPPNWWGFYSLGFGVIGPFISGVLIIAVIFVNRFLEKEKKK